MDLCLEGVKGKGDVINLHCMLLWVNPLVYSEYVLFSLVDNKVDLIYSKA